MRVATMTVDADGRGSMTLQLQWDMYPAWLDVARFELTRAEQARASNPGPDSSADFIRGMNVEMAHAMTSICAVAFALEAFSSSVRAHHATPIALGAKSTAAARIQATLTSAFRVPNHLSKGMRVTVGQIFQLRNKAVHPPIGFVDPVRHPVWPVAVEQSFYNFSVENAAKAVASIEEMIPYLLGHPRSGSEDWLKWCEGALVRLGQASPLSMSPDLS